MFQFANCHQCHNFQKVNHWNLRHPIFWGRGKFEFPHQQPRQICKPDKPPSLGLMQRSPRKKRWYQTHHNEDISWDKMDVLMETATRKWMYSYIIYIWKMNRMEMISHLFFLINDIWDASCFPSSLCYVLDLVDEKWRWDLQKTTELDRN